MKILIAFMIMLSIGLSIYVGSVHIKTLNNTTEDSLINHLKSRILALKLSGFTLTDIRLVYQGSYTPVATGKELTDLPAFCLMAATLRPTSGSLIKIELWMPIKNWNGRLLGTGNGGGAGSIIYASLAGGIKQGYATVNTDMGTSRGGAGGAVNNPEIWADFGYRATHEMTVVAKALLKVYYGRAQHHAYFAGCSTGGQQALMEVQRFPDDYNGVIAGAPANNRTHLHSGFLWNHQVTGNGEKEMFSSVELAFIARKITSAYARRSGGAPGDDFLTDPGIVSVDFDSLFKYKAGSTDSSLTVTQIAALKKIYRGPINPRTQEQIYTSMPVGSENVAAGLKLQQATAGVNGLFYQFKWVFGNSFDHTRFDFDRDQSKMDSILAPLLNANNPDLAPFKKLGGKIVMYTGTADPLVPYQDAVNYYERVIANQHGLKQTQAFFRYYLIPGMAHCSGGPGLNGFSHNILTDIVDWVENGKAPNEIVATALNCCVVNGPPRLQRPVYPYPLFPHYTGGDASAASSYIGVTHRGGKLLVPAEKYLN